MDKGQAKIASSGSAKTVRKDSARSLSSQAVGNGIDPDGTTQVIHPQSRCLESMISLQSSTCIRAAAGHALQMKLRILLWRLVQVWRDVWGNALMLKWQRIWG